MWHCICFPSVCLCTTTLQVYSRLPVQEEVYRATTKGLIEGLISGYNATVFAYGPTGVCVCVCVCVYVCGCAHVAHDTGRLLPTLFQWRCITHTNHTCYLTGS